MRLVLAGILLHFGWIGVGHCDFLLLKGGTVVNADRQFKADVLVEGDKIKAVGLSLKPGKARVIDASGMYVLPGGIDPHTHLDMPFGGTLSCDDFYSGQAAALAGGTTTHIDFALPIEGDLAAGFARHQRHAERSVMDHGFHMAITTWNDKVAADMEMLVAAGVSSFKFFLAYKGVFAVTDEQLLHGLAKAKELGAVAMVHCENGDGVEMGQKKVFESGITGPEGHYLSRPYYLEDEATYRAIKLAEFVGTPLYVVHVMSAGAASAVAAARAQGQHVIGEAVASGIAAEERSVFDLDFKVAAQYVMSPPIRGPEAQRQLRGHLAGGGLQLIATDHAPFNSSQKALGRDDFRKIPNGVNGIEERLHIVWDELVNSGLIGAPRFVELVSTEAAKIFGLYPRKGVIQEGSDADIIIFDPHMEHVISSATHHSRIDTNIYEGRKVRGKVVTTVSQGKVVWDKGELRVTEGAGRFLRRPAFGPLFDGLEQRDANMWERLFPYGFVPVKQGPAGFGGKDEL